MKRSSFLTRFFATVHRPASIHKPFVGTLAAWGGAYWFSVMVFALAQAVVPPYDQMKIVTLIAAPVSPLLLLPYAIFIAGIPAFIGIVLIGWPVFLIGRRLGFRSRFHVLLWGFAVGFILAIPALLGLNSALAVYAPAILAGSIAAAWSFAVVSLRPLLDSAAEAA